VPGTAPPVNDEPFCSGLDDSRPPEHEDAGGDLSLTFDTRSMRPPTKPSTSARWPTKGARCRDPEARAEVAEHGPSPSARPSRQPRIFRGAPAGSALSRVPTDLRGDGLGGPCPAAENRFGAVLAQARLRPT
jgi:hypothetical protein